MTRQEKIDKALKNAYDAKALYRAEEKRLRQLWIDAENLADEIIKEAEDDPS